MKIYRFLLIILAIHFFAIAKGQVIGEVNGRIVDSTTNRPIGYANILVKGSFNGTTSNSDGTFWLPLGRSQDTLVISFVGYQTKQVAINGDSLFISLVPVSYLLPTAQITSDRSGSIRRIQPRLNYTAFDFDFYDEFLLLVSTLQSRSKSYLFLMDNEGHLVIEKKLSVRPDSLFRDCLGNLHLFAEDSVYQIHFDYQQLHLLYPVYRKHFMSTLGPCQARLKNTYVSRYPSFRGLRNTFFYTKDGESVPFFKMEAEEKLSYININYDVHYFLEQRSKQNPLYQVSVDYIHDNLELLQHIALSNEGDWLDYKITAPLHSQVIARKNDLCLFDFDNTTIYRFNEFYDQIEELPITFHEEEKWGKELLVDPVTKELYTTIWSKSLLQIIKLDHETFQEKERIIIADKQYPEKIKIKNGYAYFLYGSPVQSLARMIYKMKL